MALASLAQARVSRTRLAGLLALAETAGHEKQTAAREKQEATDSFVEKKKKRRSTKERLEMMEAGEAAAGEVTVMVGASPERPQNGSAAAEGVAKGGVAVGIQGGEFWWAEPAPPGSTTELGNGAAAAAKPGEGAKLRTSKPGKGGTSTTATRTAAAGAPAATGAPPEQLAAQRPTLRDISLEVRAGELVAVVGQTGAGKSSLCAAMLGEMVQREGAPLVAPPSAAYCAQTAWILNATVRENIVFGEAFDAARYAAATLLPPHTRTRPHTPSPVPLCRYAAVLQCCQLTADLAALPHGDETEIGERGITLSGGQKQRVAIARAAYSARSVCILDDVLSALDPEVASAVFEECILGLLAGSGTTVVLVTNRLDLAPRCDRVVLIESDARGVGTITQSGSHDSLLGRGGAYAALLADSSVSQLSASEQDGKRATKQATKLATKQATKLATEAAKTPEAGAAAAAGTTAAAATAAAGPATKLMQQEERALGAVTGGVYSAYIRRGGGFGFMVPLLLLHLLTTGLTTWSSLWVGFWTADAAPMSEDDEPYSTLPFAAYVSPRLTPTPLAPPLASPMRLAHPTRTIFRWAATRPSG